MMNAARCEVLPMLMHTYFSKTKIASNLSAKSLSITLLLGGILMEILAFRGLVDEASANRPVAKVFTLFAFPGPSSEQVLHNLKDFGLHNRASV